MAIAFVQATSGTNATGATSTTATSAFSGSVVDGNSIIVGIANDGNNTSVTSITDNFGNSYSKITSGATDTVTAQIWAAFNVKGGASLVVTANQGFNDGAIFAHEYSGIEAKPKAVLDFNFSNGGGASMSTSIGSTNSNDTLIFVVGEMDIVGSNSLTVGSGYSNFTTASSNVIRGAVQSKIVTTAVAQTADMTMNAQGGASWRITMVRLAGKKVDGIGNKQFSWTAGNNISVSEIT